MIRGGGFGFSYPLETCAGIKGGLQRQAFPYDHWLDILVGIGQLPGEQDVINLLVALRHGYLRGIPPMGSPVGRLESFYHVLQPGLVK